MKLRKDNKNELLSKLSLCLLHIFLLYIFVYVKYLHLYKLFISAISKNCAFLNPYRCLPVEIKDYHRTLTMMKLHNTNLCGSN